MKKDVKIEIARTIIRLMQTEGTDWTKPWASIGAQRNANSGKPYRGVNVLLTGMAAMEKQYSSPFWNTYKGWEKIGYQVEKGEKATSVIFWKLLKIEDDGKEKTVPFARFYPVFNAGQLTETYDREIEAAPCGASVDETADQIIADTGADVRFGGGSAFYTPKGDYIACPDRDSFFSTDGFYSTLFHELGHWTGAASRLDRKLTGSFGAPEYAFEELIAELTSALMCVHSGVTPAPRADHARYLNNWIEGLTEKPEAIMRAFSAAQKAADFILDTSTEEVAIAA